MSTERRAAQTHLEAAHEGLVSEISRTYLPASETAIIGKGDIERIVGKVESTYLDRGLINVEKVLESIEPTETPNV